MTISPAVFRAKTSGSEEELTPPFQVSGVGNAAVGNQNQRVSTFTVPVSGTYQPTTDIFHSYSATFTGRTSQGLAIVKAGDAVTTASNRLFYQYWQRDNVSQNTQYDLVATGYETSGKVPHSALNLSVTETYELWRISNTGTFRAADTAQITLEELASRYTGPTVIDGTLTGSQTQNIVYTDNDPAERGFLVYVYGTSGFIAPGADNQWGSAWSYQCEWNHANNTFAFANIGSNLRSSAYRIVVF